MKYRTLTLILFTLLVIGGCAGIDTAGKKPFEGSLLPVSNDIDRDNVSNDIDNCPETCNAQQLDADNDDIGDVCDNDPGCGGCSQPDCETKC